jgi:cell division protein FtsB
VQKANPDLVALDKEGKPYTVRYEAVNAMLLNEFLKEHPKVQEIGAAVSQLEKELDTLTAELREHAAKIQKMNDQLELSKAAPQTVLNNQ